MLNLTKTIYLVLSLKDTLFCHISVLSDSPKSLISIGWKHPQTYLSTVHQFHNVFSTRKTCSTWPQRSPLPPTCGGSRAEAYYNTRQLEQCQISLAVITMIGQQSKGQSPHSLMALDGDMDRSV